MKLNKYLLTLSFGIEYKISILLLQQVLPLSRKFTIADCPKRGGQYILYRKSPNLASQNQKIFSDFFAKRTRKSEIKI